MRLDLELRHLRTLQALRRAGNLLRAAQLLSLTQSALSHQIKTLEERLGGALFERKSNPLVFSASGLRLLALADEVLPQIIEAEREALSLAQGEHGSLRIALECHTCFDWLMPVMHEFRRHWPEVEVDLVSGFHSQPSELLQRDQADLVIVGQIDPSPQWVTLPLFRFEILALLPHKHRLQQQRRLQAADFSDETLITYPVPEERIDLIRELLHPAGIRFERRTAELTVAILQLVASRRGLAALPNWAVKNYVDYDYVQAKAIGPQGLWSNLYVQVPQALASKGYVQDFVEIIREQCAQTLDGIVLLPEAGSS